MAIKVKSSWPGNTTDFYRENESKGINWTWQDWPTGSPITQGKLQNLENGVAILATQMNAILGEFNPSSLDDAQLNASRLDTIQKWITAAENGNYEFTKGSIAARLNSIDTLNTQQNNRLDSIESVNSTQSIDISSLKTRATNLENRATAIETLNTTQNNRLNNIENKNIEQDGRLNTLESTTSAHTTKLNAVATEVWGTDTTSGGSRIDKLTTELYGSNTTDYDSTSRLDSAITKLSQVTTELYGSDNTSVTSRLDDLEKEIGGARTSNGTGYTNSRIDTLESTSTSYGTRLTDIETKNTTQDNKLAAIMSELGGTGNDGTNTTYGGTSRLDSVITEVWGSNTTSGNSRLNNIETHDASVDKAIAAIKAEIGGTYVENSGFTNSRINTLTTEIYGANDTSIASRLDDLEKEVCGEVITRTSNGTGYDNSRIDKAETNIENADARLNTLEETTSTHTTNIVDLQTKMGDGVVNPHTNISDAIRQLLRKVEELDPTGSIEILDNIVTEIWGEDGIDTTKESYIDILKTKTTTLETNVNTLASEKEELKQKLNETNAKIPIEMYVATNTSASDTIVLNATPRDKSIFFIAIPQGTLGTNNLTLQTPDIQFNNVLINRIYNGNGMKIKYSAGSLISIYRNGANAYAYNVPMVL